MAKKTPRSVKMIREIIAILEKEGKEINSSTVMSWVLGQLSRGTHIGAKYEGLKQKDVNVFFRDYYKK